MTPAEQQALLAANTRWIRWLAEQQDQPPMRGWTGTSGNTGDGQYELYYPEIECWPEQEEMRRQFEREALEAIQ